MIKTAILVRGISGIIPGGISVKDFAMVIQMDTDYANKVLEYIVKNGIGHKEDNIVEFAAGDKLKMAMLALQDGASVEEVSEQLDWRDFENLVGDILQTKECAVIKNLILKNPKRQIDVIGIKMGIAMLIDCKHWKRTSSSAMKKSVEKQIQRTRQYTKQTNGAISVPVMVTLYQEEIKFINKVPIVPIIQFPSFVDEFYGNLDEMKTISE